MRSNALGGIRAGDGVIERGRKAVDVGPRALLGRDELLGRGIARREDRGHRRRSARHRRARGAEIDQRRPALGIDHDVGRLDVAMQEARRHGLPPARRAAGTACRSTASGDKRPLALAGAVRASRPRAAPSPCRRCRWPRENRRRGRSPARRRAWPGCAPRRGSARGPRRIARHDRSSAAAPWCRPSRRASDVGRYSLIATSRPSVVSRAR